MVYRVEWRVEAVEELKRFFSRKHQQAIVDKVQHFADNLPASLSLKSVQPIRNASAIPGGGRAFEVDVAAGPRAAVVVVEEAERVVVYMVGPHDYANERFVSALEERMH